MSIGRGKSPSGEENFTLARNDAARNDAEGSAQLFHQSGSFVRRWVMRASRDGSMMAIVRHRVKDDFRLDFQWC